MMRRRFRPVPAFFIVAMLVLTSTLAYGQGGASTGTLSGTVVDSSGGVIPGVDVVAKDNATGTEFRAVTDATGKYTIPAIPAGVYKVTISLMGFKSVVLPDVGVTVGTSSNVKAVVLEVGKLEETVVVQGAAEIVQTQSAAVSTTLTTTQITRVPLATRNTLDFVTALPGVNTTSTARASSVMGLQPSAVNITIDGINVQDNYLKSDANNSFFARINPRMDAVEEVTVSTANPGAESGGQGAVQIRFQTRSGTNKFTGSAYEYHREPGFNTNYWFNIRNGLPKDQIKVNTWGFRQGGPVVIPKLFDGHDKLFFFFNFEQFHQPGTQSRTRTILTKDAINGLFTYNVSGGTRTVDLYQLAAAKYTATPDASMVKFLNAVYDSAAGAEQLTTGNPITRTFSFANPYSQIRRYPTLRFDYNITSRHRVGLSYYLQQYRSIPDTLNTADPRYPGFPGTGGQNSDRFSYMGNWRWTINSNMVSEVRAGITGGPVKFADGVTKETWKQAPFDGFGGFLISPSFISTPYTSTAPSLRDAPTYVLEDTISWLKGKHGINIGASFTQVNLNLTTYRTAPSLGFGVDTNDPANAMFTTANFPGASSTNLSDARALYAMLTGRVTSISGNAYLDGATNKYVYMGNSQQLAHQRELGFYVQDSYRMAPSVTLNYGIRYEVQLPFVALNNYYSRPLDYANLYGISGVDANGDPNLFKPGTQTGAITQLKLWQKGDKGYNVNWANFAPSAGIAWRPSISSPTLKKLLGADPVIRGGYSKAYVREGMNAIDSIYNANPGGSISAQRNMSLGNLVESTSQLPLLLRNGFAALGAPGFNDTPAYPLTPLTSNSVNEFYPNTATPYAHSFNISFQRALSKNTAVDLRYVGTRNYGGWQIGGRNMNEWNLVENGFLDEFKKAQANLAANLAAGKGATFAYSPSVNGTVPLPTFQAYLDGTTNSFYSNSTFVNYLASRNPNPTEMARRLQTSNSAYAGNAVKNGLPANFFIVNPGVSTGGAWVTGRPEDGTKNRYDAVQAELRRRMSGGFLIQGSYQYVINSFTTQFFTLRFPGDYTSTSAPHHSLKANWVFELPFGQGKAVGGGVSRGLNRLIGGWTFDGNIRLQSGNTLDFGNMRLVGMSDADLQKAFKLRFQQEDDGKTHVYMLPQDIIDNTRKAFSVSATSADGYSSLGAPTGRYFAPVSGPDCINGYSGQCTGNHPLHHYVTGPKLFRADMAVGKRVELTSRVFMDLRLEAMNVFDTVNFFGTTGTGTETSDFEVTSAYRDSSNTQDPGGRLLQLSFRISW